MLAATHNVNKSNLDSPDTDRAPYELFAQYPDLLTTAHIAEITGFNVQYVRQLCREQVLPAIQIGARAWFVPKTRFIDYVNGEQG